MRPPEPQRSKEVFGDDADVWRPERCWRMREGEIHGQPSDYSKPFFSSTILKLTAKQFGYGSRTCVETIALVEMNKFTAQFSASLTYMWKQGTIQAVYLCSQIHRFWVTISKAETKERKP